MSAAAETTTQAKSAAMEITISNNATNFFMSHVLAAYDLNAENFMHALEVSAASVAGSAAVQSVLGAKNWLCGDIDIFVRDQDDAAIMGSFLETFGYSNVWAGDVDPEEYSAKFAAAAKELHIYQRWMPWNRIGPSPGAGTAYEGIERFGADVRVRRAFKIFVGLEALDAMDIDCCATTLRVVAGQATWDIVGDIRRRKVVACEETTDYRIRKYESYGLDVVV